MKLTLRRYSWVLLFQFALLGGDLFFNAFGPSLARNRLQTAIFFFVIQDTLIIAEYLLFTLTLHSTCVYQHFWIIYQYRQPPGEDGQHWPLGLIALSVGQRIMSVVYYYSSKSTALTMADPRFKEEHLDWIADQLGDK
ncbi:transmembrane protein 138-like isoform X4 [Drosophila takahashii]|uniref:transmembrane protein 138 isoform X4 n=1 Tax=Drosophila takahashii TaxID=29030 RepID=UPI0007E819BA|nr:transmembrane protein 138 isoform X4 [Drosophila takahashii]XP_044249532.1 transmembrane protein 138 isoform X2 [Drosophila takahashii]XP_044249544.1 transmembrane protein 138-like isoform X2 [Drosophila takahashii]